MPCNLSPFCVPLLFYVFGWSFIQMFESISVLDNQNGVFWGVIAPIVQNNENFWQYAGILSIIASLSELYMMSISFFLLKDVVTPLLRASARTFNGRGTQVKSSTILLTRHSTASSKKITQSGNAVVDHFLKAYELLCLSVPPVSCNSVFLGALGRGSIFTHSNVV